MPELKDLLRRELTASMKARDQIRSGTIRMVLTAISNAEVSGKEAHELTDDDILGLLATELKKRKEAAEAFDNAGREELAAKERAEAEVLVEFLPQALTDEEVTSLVADAIAQTGAAELGMKAMGKVMGIVTPQTRGRADGAQVAAEVRRQLA